MERGQNSRQLYGAKIYRNFPINQETGWVSQKLKKKKRIGPNLKPEGDFPVHRYIWRYNSFTFQMNQN